MQHLHFLVVGGRGRRCEAERRRARQQNGTKFHLSPCTIHLPPDAVRLRLQRAAMRPPISPGLAPVTRTSSPLRLCRVKPHRPENSARACAKCGDAFRQILGRRRQAPARPSIGASRSSPSAKLIIALTICTATGPRLAMSAAMPRRGQRLARRGDLVDEAERERLLRCRTSAPASAMRRTTEAPKRRTSRWVPTIPAPCRARSRVARA